MHVMVLILLPGHTVEALLWVRFVDMHGVDAARLRHASRMHAAWQGRPGHLHIHVVPKVLNTHLILFLCRTPPLLQVQFLHHLQEQEMLVCVPHVKWNPFPRASMCHSCATTDCKTHMWQRFARGSNSSARAHHTGLQTDSEDIVRLGRQPGGLALTFHATSSHQQPVRMKTI